MVIVAFRPQSSIAKKQKTVDLEKMKETEMKIKEKFDVTIAPRVVPVVESVVSIVLVDFSSSRANLAKSSLTLFYRSEFFTSIKFYIFSPNSLANVKIFASFALWGFCLNTQPFLLPIHDRIANLP